ncbi:MAG: LysR family transcriptional regulator [Sandaracinus sp.]|nr:LysR family transcriptional regulator [Sandaracinus sp.]
MGLWWSRPARCTADAWTCAGTTFRYLEAIQRCGKVSAAARDLGIGSSTLYRRVAELESRLDRVCLHRGPSGGTLTPVGEELAEVGRRTRDGLSTVEGRLRAEATGRDR